MNEILSDLSRMLPAAKLAGDGMPSAKANEYDGPCKTTRSQSSPNCLSGYELVSETLRAAGGKSYRGSLKKISQLIIDVNSHHPYDLRRKLKNGKTSASSDRRCGHVSRTRSANHSPSHSPSHSPNRSPDHSSIRSSNQSPNHSPNQKQRKKIRRLCNSCSTNHNELKLGNPLFVNLKNGDDYISKLPDEVLLKIFSYLGEKELSAASPVSKKFNSISNDSKLWKQLYQNLYEYDLPLFREANGEFAFKSAEEVDLPNPWKTAFKQLYSGIHVRDESDLDSLRNEVLKRSPAFTSTLGQTMNQSQTLNHHQTQKHFGNQQFSDRLNDRLNDRLSEPSFCRSPLVFVHKGHYKPKSIIIDYDAALIGAAPGPVDGIAKQVVIENDKETTFYFTNGVRNSYLGYVTLLFKPEEKLCYDQSPQAPQPPNALRIDKMARPKITNCIMRSTCEIGSTIYVTGEGSEPRIIDCRITDCMNVGCFVDSYAKGWYQSNFIARNALAGVWIKHNADPVFKLNTIANGRDVGVFVFNHGRGYFYENDIFGNRIAGFECKAGANPTVIKCTIHHGETGGVYCHESSRGQFLENKIYSNKFAGIWITSKSNPTIRSNEIFNGHQGGVYVFGEGMGTIENNNIYGE